MDIALDCETGGLDAEVNPLLGFDLWRPGGPCFSARVCGVGRTNRFGAPMSIHPRALQANGLDPSGGGRPTEVAKDLVSWWKGIGSPQLHLVGHNVGPFDVPFLKQLMYQGVDVPWGLMFDYHYQDTATLAYAMQQASVLHFGKWSLTNVCQVLGILYDPHLSRCDAKAAWYAWQRMTAILTELAVGRDMAKIRTEVLAALDLRG